MEKLKLLICIFLLCSASDIYSQVSNVASCNLNEEENCMSYEYSGDLNRNKMAHGKGRLVWQDGTEIEGEWVNGNLIKGKSISPDGSTYEGGYKNFKVHGYGKKLWSSTGDTYEGRWKSDKKHGEGVYIFQSAEEGNHMKEYRGSFVEDKMTGNGSIVYLDGSTYEGGVKDSGRHGYGEFIYPDRKSSYKGYFRENLFHGKGIYILNERRIEGTWKENLMDGYATITYANGGVFTGYLKNNKFEGPGKATMPEYSYSGGYKEGNRHGRGKLTLINGTVLDGEFENNYLVKGTKINAEGIIGTGKFNKEGNLEGEGTVEQKGTKDMSPFKYYGNFKNGVLGGLGRKQWKDGDIDFEYVGEFKNARFNGFGEIRVRKPTEAWGKLFYRGEFKEDSFHGKGTQIQDRDEAVITLTGEWQNMKPHGQVTVDTVRKDNGAQSYFVGTMKNGLIEGYGEKTNIRDGVTTIYKGNHRHGSPIGKAIVTTIDSETKKKHVWEGNFNAEGRLDGNGSRTFDSGAQDSGYFEDGMLVNGTMIGALGLSFDTEPFRRGEVIIRSIREDGAAFDSGLMEGDHIIAAKGEDSDWTNLSDLNQQQLTLFSPLRVKNNSRIDLKIDRQNGNLTEERVFSLTSTTIYVTPTKDELILENNPRVALVIGNGNYNSSSLENSINDAKLIKKSLDDKDFKTILKLDTDKEGFKKAIWEFGDLIEESGPNTTALFFYSGHGIQVNGKNYLIPLGVKIKRLREVEIEAISADEIMNALAIAEKGVKIMILDACRDNPFKSFSRNLVKGLAEMDSPTGTIIAYSTAPGRTALDGGFDYENSVYTKNLVESMDVYDLKIEEVFKRTRREVERMTEGEQVPWESSSLLGDFYFNKLN